MHRPWLNPCKIISNVNGTLGTNAIMSGILVYPGKGDTCNSSFCVSSSLHWRQHQLGNCLMTPALCLTCSAVQNFLHQVSGNGHGF